MFRHFEHTTLASIINEQCEQILDGHCLFNKEFLVHSTEVNIFGVCLLRSSRVVLQCGELAAGDVLYIQGGVVARACCFWEFSGNITVQCKVCERLSEHENRDGEVESFFSADRIVDAVSHRRLPGGSFRVLLLFKAFFN